MVSLLFGLYMHIAVDCATTVAPTKSDSDEILCLQLIIKQYTCTIHLIKCESIAHLCINPILRIGLIHK